MDPSWVLKIFKSQPGYGINPANQLRLVVYPIIYRVFTSQGWCRISSINSINLKQPSINLLKMFFLKKKCKVADFIDSSTIVSSMHGSKWDTVERVSYSLIQLAHTVASIESRYQIGYWYLFKFIESHKSSKLRLNSFIFKNRVKKKLLSTVTQCNFIREILQKWNLQHVYHQLWSPPQNGVPFTLW